VRLIALVAVACAAASPPPASIENRAKPDSLDHARDVHASYVDAACACRDYPCLDRTKRLFAPRLAAVEREWGTSQWTPSRRKRRDELAMKYRTCEARLIDVE